MCKDHHQALITFVYDFLYLSLRRPQHFRSCCLLVWTTGIQTNMYKVKHERSCVRSVLLFNRRYQVSSSPRFSPPITFWLHFNHLMYCPLFMFQVQYKKSLTRVSNTQRNRITIDIRIIRIIRQTKKQIHIHPVSSKEEGEDIGKQEEKGSNKPWSTSWTRRGRDHDDDHLS